ncbi:uncharacterized protein DS421_10g297600 [Arachis hypogaea]|nr:uncharacterized protein DS421_10g297600 [Arachis hypogaea]
MVGFIQHNITLTFNHSEVTVEMIVLIFSIMRGEEVRVEELILYYISVIAKNKTSRIKLGFSDIIHWLCQATGVSIEEGIPVKLERPITKAVMERAARRHICADQMEEPQQHSRPPSPHAPESPPPPALEFQARTSQSQAQVIDLQQFYKKFQ